METQSPSSRERRVTWSLPAIVQARSIFVQLIGESKRTVLQDVFDNLAVEPREPMAGYRQPILAVLEQTRLCDGSNGVPIQIFLATE